MAYSSTTVARIVDRINQTYFLPAIQRPFVWEPSQVVALFDSILKGYPISSFLFWELRADDRRNWQIYKFAEHFKFGEVHNDIADPDGREVVLVLDGQQRLTSFLIGMRGSYTIKNKGKRWDNPSAWSKRRLYIDLFKDPNLDNEDDDQEIGVTFGLRFFADQPKNNEEKYWFKVGKILDFKNEEEFYSSIEVMVDALPETATRRQISILRKNLDNLYRKIWKDEIVAFFTEKDPSYERVLDIFVRANDGGTKLSKSDLLLSMITSKWSGVNAREEIYEFVDHLNNNLLRKNDLNKDFIMRSCLVASDLDHHYKVTNFTNEALFAIQRAWPDIKSAIAWTLNLVNSFGIDRDTLTSVNALLPIMYFISKVKMPFDGSTEYEFRNREKIKIWLLSALLNNAFGGNSDLVIGATRQAIREALLESKNFPDEQVYDAILKRQGRQIRFDAANVSDLLEIRYSNRTCFLALSLLYDEQSFGQSMYHIDHIIPRALCSRKHLTEIGIEEGAINEIVRSVDRIGNLQILLGRENSEKHSQEFPDWLRSRDGGYLKKHFIPNEPRLWRPEALLAFISAREALIKQRLQEIIALPPLSTQ